jgi:hypothetical protein
MSIDSPNNSYSFYSNTRTPTTIALRFDPSTLTIRIRLREDNVTRDAIALGANKIKASERRAWLCHATQRVGRIARASLRLGV